MRRSEGILFYSRDNLHLEHDLAVTVAINPRIRAAQVAHKVKIIRIESFADPFVDQRHRYGELGYKIDAHFVRTEPGYEIAVQVQSESLPCNAR